MDGAERRSVDGCGVLRISRNDVTASISLAQPIVACHLVDHFRRVGGIDGYAVIAEVGDRQTIIASANSSFFSNTRSVRAE